MIRDAAEVAGRLPLTGDGAGCAAVAPFVEREHGCPGLGALVVGWADPPTGRTSSPPTAPPEYIDGIADGMVFLETLFKALTGSVADDENLPGQIRRAAALATEAAGILWSHYGGDSGGW